MPRLLQPYGGVHYFQRSFSPKPIALANQRLISCGTSMGRGNEICISCQGHMTKMDATLIYGINL